MFVFGTAGHIDHGKTALIYALTSIDTDRLPEEKERGMTIDLGFAWMKLPSGEKVGIVDVPGHENLIKNMIAGATGIDAVILVIDANEGWMPQTEEHFQIVDLLDIKYGIIAITKIDLVDQTRLNFVEKQIKEKLKNTALFNAPIVKVSTVKNIGIDQIKLAIQDLIPQMKPKKDIGKPRLFIDRAFNIKGSGTVVTGTLIGGTLHRGMAVTIFPSYKKTRIRNLQTYKETTEKAFPGSRVALNLVGMEKNELHRGDIVFGIKQIKASKNIDVQIQLLPQLKKYSLTNRSELFFFTGTKEILAKVILNQKKYFEPGETGFAQLRFKEPLATYLGDRFILRIPSPPKTIGGGLIIDPLAHKHHFKDKDILHFLQKRIKFDLRELVLTELKKNIFIKKDNLLINSNYTHSEIREVVESLKKEGEIITTNSWLINKNYWQEQKTKFMNRLSQEYELYPLQTGFPLNKFQSYFYYLKPEIFNYLIDSLINTDKIGLKKGIVFFLSRKPKISLQQKVLISKILKILKDNPTNPPNEKTLISQIAGSKEIINFLIQEGEIVKLSDGILLESKNYVIMKNKLIDFLKINGSISIAQVRELLGISRKYIIPLLNKMDEEKITQRKENVRILKTKLG
ncbi:selenocysteine-specific translation elongation factor [Candidatus Atribacteria bacterium 1244-E10-H5-B2]|nr:MAG: selenocysteine-specific translation elongation factor [Candidatus Atribacteria bacterium 1244-E10-H5-B2]